MENQDTLQEQDVVDIIKRIVPDMIKTYLKTSAFTDRKLTDTPTDSLSVVNRKYVTMNGTARPTGSVMGQSFFDTSLSAGTGKLITWNGTGWVDGSGSYV